MTAFLVTGLMPIPLVTKTVFSLVAGITAASLVFGNSFCRRSPWSCSPSGPGGCVSWEASHIHSCTNSFCHSAWSLLKMYFLFLFQRLLHCDKSFFDVCPLAFEAAKYFLALSFSSFISVLQLVFIVSRVHYCAQAFICLVTSVPSQEILPLRFD